MGFPSRRSTVTALLLATVAVVEAAEFRNFNLPCLAPLLQQLDSEAPATMNLAFLRGPTRAPVLRDDIGTVNFPITTTSPEAASFFHQGVALLHGLSNAEAERSFRQAAVLDPDNPMVLWGLAVANEQRPQRARLFAQNAVRRIRNETTRRERLWIASLTRFYNIRRDGPAKLPPTEKLTSEQRRERHRQRIRDLEEIVLAFPEDVEAKAFLLRQLTLDAHRSGIGVTSHVAVDRLAQELIELAPAHPSRHYRIFLWLRERPQQALHPAGESAALAPGIADSWRYAAEAWRANGHHHRAVPLLEAALRVDHRHMREKFLMPGATENLASNYAAIVDALGSMGRVDEALQWAQRMLSLPREPGGEDGSGTDFSLAGRRLVVETLLRAEQVERLRKELETSALLRPDPASRRERAHAIYWKALALAALGDFEKLKPLEQELLGFAKSPETRRERDEVAALVAGLTAFAELCRGAVPADDPVEPPDVPLSVLARAWAKAGEGKKALELARDNFAKRPGQLVAGATFCELSFAAGEIVPAMAAFDRTFRENAMRADDDLPVLPRLAPLAAKMKLPTRWMLPAAGLETPGAPPDPDALGPASWTPPAAPNWALPNHAGRDVSLNDFRGEAVLLNFFLGMTCPYCLTQLNKFRPHLPAFKELNVSMIAISTDSREELAERLGNEEETSPAIRLQYPYPILADPKLEVFKAYGVFDDFEGGPMHATFLIDPRGRVLWSDVSHEPFDRPESLLAETKRLTGVYDAPRRAPGGR